MLKKSFQAVSHDVARPFLISVRSLMRSIRRFVRFVPRAIRYYGNPRFTWNVPSSHGHYLLLQNLFENLQNGRLPEPLIIEIGGSREITGGLSTRAFAHFSREAGYKFISVDMDPHQTAKAHRIFSAYRYHSSVAVNGRGEDFLANFPKSHSIDSIYFDAFDIDHGRHSHQRLERYQTLLGKSITNTEASKSHLQMVKNLFKDRERSFFPRYLCFDDTWLDGSAWQGKGAQAVPFVMSTGYRVNVLTETCVLLSLDHASLN